uniref:Pectin acetylesterase n=1 Tax=Chenopodium quinoa TaxID=63459 RepID=A0A803N604_CHEQI
MVEKIKQKGHNTAIVGLSLIFFSFSFIFNSPKKAALFTLNSDYVPLTLLSNAKQRAAFCLDGSLPGYHFHNGFGSGSDKWVLHIEGGDDGEHEGKDLAGGARDFFNWNKVKIRYCDGSSFTGHSNNELHNGTSLFFRGQLIWEAVMDELLAKGMSNARQALLSGCSAGGLATMIHCDDIRAKLPKIAIVKCLADASFFLDEKDINGRRTTQLFYKNVVNLHGAAKSLSADCVAKMEPSLCFFPQHIVGSMNTPLFLVNPAYDFWQIQHVLIPAASDLPEEWQRCRLNIQNCNSHQLDTLQGFRSSLLNALGEFKKNAEWGMFINSCFIHCQTWMETWHGPNSPKVNSKTIAETVGDWYFNKELAKRVDCPFPCNPSCFNMDFAQA